MDIKIQCIGTKGYWIGKKLSAEHKENLSKSHIGQQAWCKGLPKELQPRFGQKQSQETKNKISKLNSGENNGMATLTKEIVELIRNDYKTGNYMQKDLAIKYKVSNYQIWSIVNNKRWKNG